MALEKKEALPESVRLNGQKGPTARQRKMWRIARKLLALSRALPNERRASLFLRSYVRFERVMNHQSPFQNNFSSGVESIADRETGESTIARSEQRRHATEDERNPQNTIALVPPKHAGTALVSHSEISASPTENLLSGSVESRHAIADRDGTGSANPASGVPRLAVSGQRSDALLSGVTPDCTDSSRSSARPAQFTQTKFETPTGILRTL